MSSRSTPLTLRKALVILLVVGALLSALGFYLTRPRLAARVGDYTLTTRDAEQRDQIVRIYYPNEKRRLGLQQLIRAYQYAQILKDHGYPMKPADIQREADRIQRTTLMPAKLKQIQAVFAGDRGAYLRVYVLPVLAERAIYFEYFLHDPSVQAQSKERVKAFLDQAKKRPRDFASLARAQGRHVASFTVSADGGMHWLEDADKKGPRREVAKIRDGGAGVAAAPAAEGSKWIHDVIGTLSPGDVFPRVVDLGETWMAARYLHPMRGATATYLLEGATFPKEDYGAWLDREVKQVPVDRRQG